MAGQLGELDVNDRISRLKEMFNRLNSKVTSSLESRQMQQLLKNVDSAATSVNAEMDNFLDFKFQEDRRQVESSSIHSEEYLDHIDEISGEYSHDRSVSAISRALTQQSYVRSSLDDSDIYSPECRMRPTTDDSELENSYISPRFPNGQSSMNSLVSSVYLQLERQKLHVEELNKVVKDKDVLLRELKAAHSEAQEELQSCWDELQGCQRSNGLLEQQLNALRVKERQLRVENDELKDMLARREEDREGYRKRNPFEESFHQLEQHYQVSLDQTDQLTDKVEKLQERIRSLTIGRDQQTAELEGLRARERHQSDEVMRMQKDRLLLREEAERARQTACMTSIELERSEGELQHQKLELEKLEGLLTSQRNLVKQLEFETESLKRDVTRKDHEIARLRTDFDKLKRSSPRKSPVKTPLIRSEYDKLKRSSPRRSPVKAPFIRSPESKLTLKVLRSPEQLMSGRNLHRRSMSQPSALKTMLKECEVSSPEELMTAYKDLQGYVKRLKKFEKLVLRLDQLVRECSPADTTPHLSTRLIWKWVRRVVEHYMAAAKYKDQSIPTTKLLGMLGLVQPQDLPRHVARLLSDNTLMSSVVEKVKQYCNLSPYTSLKELDCTLDYKLQVA
jgi:chromosome segregation ATPase